MAAAPSHLRADLDPTHGVMIVTPLYFEERERAAMLNVMGALS
jgi:hypothetical protein